MPDHLSSPIKNGGRKWTGDETTEGGSGDYVQFSWRSPAIPDLQSDCRYVNNNEQITCRSHARALGANDGDGASFGSS